MVKANELRIGNWVNERFLTENFNFSILSVSSEYVAYNPKISYHINTIYPIPLTPDILIKAGFIFQYNNYYYDKNAGDYSLSIGDKCYWAGDMDDVAEVPKPNSVHQLQNLWFALTGKELEIML